MAYTTSKTLLHQIQEGDDTAWSNFYLIYSPLIKSCGRKYRLDEDEIQDLIQNVMVKLFAKKAVSTYDAQKGKFRTYLGRIIFSVIMDMKRKSASLAEKLSENMQENAELAVSRDEIQEMIEGEWQDYVKKEAMLMLRQRVSEDVYQAFQMLTEYEMEPNRVAEFLHLPLRHVYDAKARCKRILEEILKTLADA